MAPAWRRLLSGDSDLRYWKGLLDYALARRRAAREGEVQPPDTNRRLLAAWQQCTRRKLPMLVVSAASATRRKYYVAYNLRPGQSEPDDNLTWNEVENTTHAMLAGGVYLPPSPYEAWFLSAAHDDEALGRIAAALPAAARAAAAALD